MLIGCFSLKKNLGIVHLHETGVQGAACPLCCNLLLSLIFFFFFLTVCWGDCSVLVYVKLSSLSLFMAAQHSLVGMDQRFDSGLWMKLGRCQPFAVTHSAVETFCTYISAHVCDHICLVEY